MVNVQRKGTQDVPILDAQPILQSCHCERSAAISLQQKRFPRPGDGGVATLLNDKLGTREFCELYPGHDPEAYRLHAWIHDYMGNHEEAERDRQLAKCRVGQVESVTTLLSRRKSTSPSIPRLRNSSKRSMLCLTTVVLLGWVVTSDQG